MCIRDSAKAALGEEGQKVYASMTPLQRMADPAEIGAAAASVSYTHLDVYKRQS